MLKIPNCSLHTLWKKDCSKAYGGPRLPTLPTKKNIVTVWGYTDNSNKWLIYPSTFLYIIIIFTYSRFFFIHTQLVKKKNYYEKFNIFACRIVILNINLWFYCYQLCKGWLTEVQSFTMLIANALSGRTLGRVRRVNYNSRKIICIYYLRYNKNRV